MNSDFASAVYILASQREGTVYTGVATNPDAHDHAKDLGLESLE